MNLETCKKVLRIAGIFSIISAVLVAIIAILGIKGGGALAGAPDATAETQQTGSMAISAGYLFLVLALTDASEEDISTAESSRYALLPP